MRAQEAVNPFSNAEAGTSAPFVLNGGRYAFSYKGTGTGTVDMKLQGADGATFIPCGLTQITATTGYQVIELPPGLYEVIIATFTANYVNIARIPSD